MSVTRTFVDANILIAMTNLTDASVFRRIREVLGDQRREFVSSDFLRLEVLPKPIRDKKQASIDFCERYFQRCSHHVVITPDLLATAYAEACRLGLSAIDAIHLASAHAAGAQELVTLEKTTKPMYRSNLVKVVHLLDA